MWIKNSRTVPKHNSFAERSALRAQNRVCCIIKQGTIYGQQTCQSSPEKNTDLVPRLSEVSRSYNTSTKKNKKNRPRNDRGVDPTAECISGVRRLIGVMRAVRDEKNDSFDAVIIHGYKYYYIGTNQASPRRQVASTRMTNRARNNQCAHPWSLGVLCDGPTGAFIGGGTGVLNVGHAVLSTMKGLGFS